MLCRDVDERSRHHATSTGPAVFSFVINEEVLDLEDAGWLRVCSVCHVNVMQVRVAWSMNSADLQVTYCEVYCEVLRDLLSEQQPARLAGAGPNKKGHTGIDVMEANGVMRLKGVTPVEVKSMEVRNM